MTTRPPSAGAALAAAFASVLAFALAMVLIGCGLHTVAQRDTPNVNPPAPSPSSDRAQPQENAR